MLFLREKKGKLANQKKKIKIKCPQHSICQHEMVTELQGHIENMIITSKWMTLFMNDGQM